MPKAGGTFTGQVTFGTTDATILPVGSTVQRPASASAGMLRYNAQTASFEGYTTAWGPLGGGGGTATAIGITPPASPTVGQLWWNSEDGLLYIYYDDATGSTQWVPAWVSPGLADTGIIDIALWYPGVPAASTTLLQFLADRAFTLPASLTGSQGFAGTVPTGSVTIDVRKNGTSQGSVNFAAATATSTFIFASAVAFAPGDRLTLVAPGTPDATLANLSVTLKGTR
jgi:hypothetical protein